MAIQWKFKIELLETDIYTKIYEEYGVKIPKILEEFIKECNAASPDKRCIMINGYERIFDAVLSFNEKEEEASTFKSIYEILRENNKYMIPFAIDPFGNYFCYDLRYNKITFYQHEEDVFEESEYSLSELIQSLY